MPAAEAVCPAPCWEDTGVGEEEQIGAKLDLILQGGADTQRSATWTLTALYASIDTAAEASTPRASVVPAGSSAIDKKVFLFFTRNSKWNIPGTLG